jgi:hypothetical protein
MSRPTYRYLLVSLLAVALTGAWLAPVTMVSAQPPDPGSTPVPTPTPGPTSTPTPGPPIISEIFHILLFPFETMTEAILLMSSSVMQQLNEQAQSVYSGALEVLISSRYGISPIGLGDDVASTPLFADLIRPHWNVTFTFALLLLPATLAMTAISTMKTSVASVLTYVDMKEALINWVFSVAAAAASYFLLGLAHRLSVLASGAIMQADFGGQVTGATLANVFFSATGLMLVAQLAPAAVLYVAGFLLFLAGGILIGLALAIAAYTALVYVLTVMAPLVLTLGVLPPLRWLSALWLKAITLVFLLPVVDAILLKAALALVIGFFNPDSGTGTLGGFIASVFVTAGVLGALLTINFKVAEVMFGAIGEMHRQFQGAVLAVASLAAGAIGLLVGAPALGLATAGAVGSGGVAGSASGGAGGAGLGSGGPGGSGFPLLPGPGSSAGPGASTDGPIAPGGGLTPFGDSPNSGGRSISAALNDSPSLSSRVSLLSAGQPGDSGGDGAGASREGNETGGDHVTAAETGSGPGSAAGTGPASNSARSATADPAAQMRRAQLMQGLGRALAQSRLPVVSAFGAGMQMGSELSAHQAREGLEGVHAQQQEAEAQHRDQAREDTAAYREAQLRLGAMRLAEQHAYHQAHMGATHERLDEQRAREAVRDHQQLLDQSLRWSTNPNLNEELPQFRDMSRDNTAIMAGALHAALANDVVEPRASDMNDVLGVVRDSYGSWLAQDRPGGYQAQLDYYGIVSDPRSTHAPETLAQNLGRWSQAHGVELPSTVPDSINRLYSRSSSMHQD